MNDSDTGTLLQERVVTAARTGEPLRIHGGNSKAFFGRAIPGEALDVSGHRGIVSYEPTELVISARAGTPLSEIEQLLARNHQMLAFEPPHFGDSATLGGTIAGNFSGPRRAHAGAARDFVLGCRIINGKGELLEFGGQVMKNVAGYDVSRLMCGALGTLGVLLEVSLKVLPGPEVETTLVLELDDQQALARLHALARQALPVSASCVHHNTLLIRLSGTAAAVSAARKTIGGDEMNDTDNYWLRLREHRLPFFNTALPVWRVSLAATAPRLDLPGDWLYEWGGAQRWLASDADAGDIRRAAAAHGGHAVCFRAARMPADVFHPLDPGLRQLHARLKQAFDPARILNRGKMYAEI